MVVLHPPVSFFAHFTFDYVHFRVNVYVCTLLKSLRTNRTLV